MHGSIFIHEINETGCQLSQSKGFLSVVYLDDFLLMSQTYEDCLKNVNDTCQLLQKLGFIINWEKSFLRPSRICKFLGFVYDSRQMKIIVPNDKKLKILALIKKFTLKKVCKIREFAKFIGMLVSICPGIKYGWLYTKRFARFKFKSLTDQKLNYDAIVSISSFLSDDFS